MSSSALKDATQGIIEWGMKNGKATGPRPNATEIFGSLTFSDEASPGYLKLLLNREFEARGIVETQPFELRGEGKGTEGRYKTMAVEVSSPPKKVKDTFWDEARGQIMHDLNLSVLPTREFVENNKWLKKTNEKTGPGKEVLGVPTVQLSADLELTPDGWRELASYEQTWLAHERMDFAFETTLASKTFAPWIAKLRDSGYRFQLLYLWLPNSELAVKRVLDRVRQGEVSMGQRCRKIATHLRSGGKG